MTDIDLDDLERKARAATPGEWKAGVDLFSMDEDIRAVVDAPNADMLFSAGTDVMPHLGPAQGWTAEDSEKRDAQWRAARDTQAMRDAEYIAAAHPGAVLALVARVRAAEGLLPRCAGTWEAGSGGHRMYARDCNKPGKWDAGLWFVCDEHKSKSGDADAWTWTDERDLLVEMLAAARTDKGSAIELATERLLIAQARIAQLEAELAAASTATSSVSDPTRPE